MSDLIKRIDEERAAYRLYGFDGSSTDLVLADCKAEIERLSKPYVPMTFNEKDTVCVKWLASGLPLGGLVDMTETAVIARYNEQRGVK